MNKTIVKCGICGVTNVRLYRPYANFYRPNDNRCNAHLTDEERNWYVPLCINKRDGSVWGYTSVPQEDCDFFYALPEADPKGLTWKAISDTGLTHFQEP